nr:immunoglobulin heavy chain junction region [Macaca mulatta]MOV53546.1 immunoglobulin heavy chain junction region [Macaca mulatta]MOV55082.1 immunoglobulin heavy chain junction region [Macaca mulatta]MOV57741.1 immunoglobulin heavy chain junction region [Macaca mulatta]MOV57770.1 immunoglobulin heavy chain junction region [Macaca mulatta]
CARGRGGYSSGWSRDGLDSW